jgi:hypothetical protein
MHKNKEIKRVIWIKFDATRFRTGFIETAELIAGFEPTNGMRPGIASAAARWTAGMDK